MDRLRTWLADIGMKDPQADWVAVGVSLLAVILLAALANLIAKGIIVRTVSRLVEKSRTSWDDALVRRQVLTRLSHFAPALIIWGMAPLVLDTSPGLVNVARRGAQIYMILTGLFVASALLNAVHDIYNTFSAARRFPIRSYLQLVKIVLGVAGGVFVLSIALDRSPWVFLSGMGALTAILLLVFKDTILGFVAGMQLVANDMVRPGDWIEMPKYGADGDVQEVTLTTVKVRNWDKTITTIPTYALISDSFKNWRGMTESGGRRIKRSLYIDVNSIKHCAADMIEKLSAIDLIREYVSARQNEIDADNQSRQVTASLPINGRRMTNIGTFRAYIVAFLRAHPQIHPDMTFLVRQLAPTERGLPLELYIFSKDQRWAQYEDIQADIFDHLYASLGYFDLRAFQLPTGSDVRQALSGQESTGPSPAT